MDFPTDVEKRFEHLRQAMLADGYTREHLALQLLARLRTSLKDKGYVFRKEPDHVSN